ncbi:MAG: hypothetical protein ISN29_04895 [Gammaproteobacteria bacterium AqS3]|nr:hypothetical protein [Gammaproteobacteria bacterium AqS3]
MKKLMLMLGVLLWLAIPAAAQQGDGLCKDPSDLFAGECRFLDGTTERLQTVTQLTMAQADESYKEVMTQVEETRDLALQKAERIFEKRKSRAWARFAKKTKKAKKVRQEAIADADAEFNETVETAQRQRDRDIEYGGEGPSDAAILSYIGTGVHAEATRDAVKAQAWADYERAVAEQRLIYLTAVAQAEVDHHVGSADAWAHFHLKKADARADYNRTMSKAGIKQGSAAR